MSRQKYIAVAGNIGSGKSSLVKFLASNYNALPIFEHNDDNPYLADFYKDMCLWGFHSQVFFLSRKFQIHQNLAQKKGTVILDRTIYEDAEIFAKALFLTNKMKERDYMVYSELYDNICRSIKPPDLMIYLTCSINTLRKRIRIRGREMEQQIPLAYIKYLQKLYDNWIDSYSASKVLILDTGKLDYLTDLVHRIDFMKHVDEYLK